MRKTSASPATALSSSSLTRHRLFPYALLVIAAASWGSNWVVARGLHEAVPPFALAFWRWTVATLLLAPIALAHVKRDRMRLGSSWRSLIALGVPGTTGFAAIGYYAVQHTTAINAALINGALPIFTLALAAIFLGTRVSMRFLIALGLAVAGLACIVTGGDPRALVTLGVNRGDALMLFGVLVWAGYTVGLHWRPAGLHPLSFLFATAVIGVAACAPAYLWEISRGETMAVDARAIAGIAWLALGPSLIAYICWNAAVARVGPSVAGLVNALVPVFGTLMSITFLGERAQAAQLLGIVLILAGVYLVSSGRSPPRAVTADY